MTDLAAVTLTTQVPVPTQAPDQPANVDPTSAAAVSVTVAPLPKLAEQVVPQLIPAGLDVTVPLPVPARDTVTVKARCVNVAVTDAAADMLTWHVPVPEQAPDQPAKADPTSATAVSVTIVPGS